MCCCIDSEKMAEKVENSLFHLNNIVKRFFFLYLCVEMDCTIFDIIYLNIITDKNEKTSILPFFRLYGRHVNGADPGFP